jgi:hypothetical protein
VSIELEIQDQPEIFDMEWVGRQHSVEEINAAGLTLIKRRHSPEELDRILAIINNWRAAHSFPLNTFRAPCAEKRDILTHQPSWPSGSKD